MSQPKKSIIEVQGTVVTILSGQQEDYISLTDIARYKDSERTDYLIQNWMRNRNTIEFLGLWERLNNPVFNPIEFDGIRKQAGLNSFILTAKRWIDATRAVGLISKAGRYGGTYAHKDIAFEFASWISVEFRLYRIKEFQRLKEDENRRLSLAWNLNRKINPGCRSRLKPSCLCVKRFLAGRRKRQAGRPRYLLRKSASHGFAAGMSGSRLAVAVGFALLAMLEVILGQRQTPFKGEMNRVRRKGKGEFVLNRPEFFKGADAATFQLRFHANIVLFRSRFCKCSLTRVAQFFAAMLHHFILNEEVIGDGFDSQCALIKSSRIRSRP